MNIAELRAINQPAKIFKIFLEIPINLLRQFSGHWLPSVLLRLGSNMAHSNGSTGMDPPSLGDLGELPKFGAVWVLCKSREKKDEASSWSSRVLLSPSMRNSSQETLSMFAAQTQRLKEIDLRDGAGRVGSSTRKKQVEDLVSALVKMRIWGRRQT